MEILQEGQEPLPRCDQCGMYMPAARMFKHRRADRCKKATEMRLIQRDVEMEERCRDMEFILYRGEGDDMV